MEATQWLERFARELGVEAPSEEEIAGILDLAAEAAHSSERIAAPVACWLGARSGRPLTELVEIAAHAGGD
jgi:Domain of unknown function (DUF6457)